MFLPEIDNLEIKHVTNDILLVHQIKPPYYFSCCDGLIILPKERRNSNAIVLDLNIEPNLVKLMNKYYHPWNPWGSPPCTIPKCTICFPFSWKKNTWILSNSTLIKTPVMNRLAPC